jgi:hypothetical protein
MLKTCLNIVKNSMTIVENITYNPEFQLITHTTITNQQWLITPFQVYKICLEIHLKNRIAQLKSENL